MLWQLACWNKRYIFSGGIPFGLWVKMKKEIVNIPSTHNGMNCPIRGRKHNISSCSKMNQTWLNNPQKQVFEKSNKSHLRGLPLLPLFQTRNTEPWASEKNGSGVTLLFWSPMFLIYGKDNGSTHRPLFISCSAMGILTKAPNTWASSAPATWHQHGHLHGRFLHPQRHCLSVRSDLHY